ncbi:PAS domain S-box-containing protein [Lutibacter oricola]|uniref:histidine kinase n=1 Tax=Lutibacter oricola TaxID=762486 RepID=A0A1H2T762_9FLAO|nr:PAS domain S-box protein [Lutibacter oricola]SDW39786.1 PAS domain S-box-containing protein [Lutibacter oricola]
MNKKKLNEEINILKKLLKSKTSELNKVKEELVLCEKKLNNSSQNNSNQNTTKTEEITNKNRFEYALNNIETGAWELDLKKFDSWRMFKHDQIFGYSKPLDEWTYEMFLAHVIPEDRERVDFKFKKALETKTDWNFECRIKRNDNNKIKWIWATGHQEFDAEQNPIKMFGIVQDITDRKKIEIERDLQAERFNMAFNQQFQFMAILSPKGITLEINNLPLDVQGVIKKEYIGNYFWESPTWKKNKKLKEKIKNQVLQAATMNTPLHTEDSFYAEDGKLHTALAAYTGIRDSNNNLKYILVQATDISEQKQAEINLKKKQYYLENAQSLGKIGSWDLNIKQNELIWTDENYRIFGLPIGTPLTYETFLNRIHPEDKKYVNKKWNTAINGGEKYDINHRLLMDDGEIKWVREKADLIFDSSGKCIRGTGFTQDITDKIKAEQKFQAIFESSPAAIYETDENGNCLTVNKKWCELSGLTEEQAKGNGWINAIHPDDRDKISELWYKYAKTGNSWNFEYRFCTPNNKITWVWGTATPLKNENGIITGYIGSNTDLTERLKAEKEIKVNAKKFQTLFEQAGDYCMVMDPNTESGIPIIADVNKAFSKALGYTKEELIGNTVAEIDDDEAKKLSLDRSKRILAGEDLHIETTHVRKDGSTFIVLAHANRIIFEDRPPLIYVTEVDITERKKNELKLRDIQNNLSAIFNNTSDAQLLTQYLGRKKFKIAAVNTAYIKSLQAFGLNVSHNDLVGKFLEDVLLNVIHLNEEVFEYTINYYQQAIDTNQQIKYLETLDINNKIYHSKTSYTPIVQEEDKTKYILYTSHDITKETEAQNKIHKLNTELEQKVKDRTAQLETTNKELETFTYSVSHDLKAPLRGIDGYSKLLQDLYQNTIDEEGKYFLSNIRSSALKMNELINDLLDYSRLERAQMRIEKINIKDFINALTSVYKMELDKENFQLQINIDNIELEVDSKGLSIALRNLIENAIKFTKGTPDPKIIISLKEKPKFWQISIEDNGIGFDMKYKERIFEIFQRLHRAEDYSGTGIGLAMVKKAMHRMNGNAFVKSTQNIGSTFYLNIPKRKNNGKR